MPYRGVEYGLYINTEVEKDELESATVMSNRDETVDLLLWIIVVLLGVGQLWPRGIN